ncbi:hypothetical protein F503_01399 [Ophiostoma piceae UAMH 11346]|uniref:Uncharacterized protein n=1 Tax=Ophiostoma piceae (strain UAMH 11346) TaxID=1262450 RepID=S3CUJ5_OPHP1|nr:hypothetical protein F503_01399 [Ophiostoma piceae UAMH 11346]
MSSLTQLEAAKALSLCLNSNGIGHAFIGGFALNVLGHERNTDDIDVLVHSTTAVIRKVMAESLRKDSRFAYRGFKLFFTPSDGRHPVPIETLPTGELGLPTSLKVFYPIYGVPVLHLDILVLTKIKRCVNFIGSTRPASVFKFSKDEGDILFLLNSMKDQHQTIDFVGYETPDPDRLYMAVQKMAQCWGNGGHVELLEAVLQPEDRGKVMAF